MNLFALSGIIISVTALVLIILLLVLGKTKLHRIWTFFNLAVLIWGIGSFLAAQASNPSSALLGWRVAISGGLFIGVFFYHTVYIFTEQRNKNTLLVVYSQAIIFLFLTLMTEKTLTNWNMLFGSIYFPRATAFYTFMVFSWVIVVSLGHKKLVLFLRISRGTKHTQAKYLLIAFLIGFIGGSLTLVPPFNINIYPYGNFGIPLYCLISTYAILRYRLMDINIAIKKTMIYSLSAGVLTSVFVVLVLASTRYLTDLTGVTSFWIMVIAALAIAFMFTPLKNKIQSLIDKIFYKTTYDYYATIRKVSHDLASKFNKDDIYSFIVNTVHSTLRLKSAYLLSGENRHFEVSFSKEQKDAPAENDGVHPLKIKRDSELVRILQESSDVIVREELPKLIDEKRSDTISNELLPFKGEVAVPVFIDDKLSHLLVLGEKLSGDIFTQEDVNLLNTIANQAAVSIKNAALYSEKMQAERLASIGKMAATLAHEIKNPLASIKVFTQLIPEKFSDIEFRESFSKIVASEIDRIDGLVSELLDFSKQTPVKRTKIDARMLLDDIIDLVSAQFDSNKINILKKYDGNSNISGEPGRLKQAILNIFINSQQAMQEGGTLDVEVSANDKYVTIAIEDNGTGIPDDVIDKIFDPFFTTKHRGAGLGLAISSKIINDHGGRISVESSKNRGTRFKLLLPSFKEV